jgi:hypothetical protein
LSRLLGVVCVGTTFAALSVAACSVPEFDFPNAPGPSVGGDGSILIDHCVNGLLDADLGESDFDCGGGCPPCGLGQHCGDVADCAEGLCHEGTCLAEGCMNSVQDGLETDVDCGGGGCKTCITGQGCGVEADCESGVCFDAKCLAPACDDQVENGKETGQDCGGDCPGCAVDQPCVSGDDCISMECNESVCGPECQDGLANCDKENDNACEINVRTDIMNCGSCGNACDLPNAASECSAGECRIQTDGCEAGFADCNGMPEDGCEVNLAQDKDNCGVCNKVCPALNGAPFCEASLCQITCGQGFDDCDNNRDNGCEKDVSRDVNNCGECGEVCPAAAGSTPYCKNNACGQTTCPAGFGDCNGEPDDGPNGNGCEVDLRIDPLNCNTCGNLCVANNATTTCANRVCQIDECVTGFDNCSGGYADGCETNINTSTAHCGGCGQGCTIANGTPKCDAGDCAINSCSGTFRDCDSNPGNGCEVNTASNTKNCGGCGAMGSDCSTKYANATSTCSMSACSAPICNPSYGDCTGGLADGCETDTRSANSHCGGCGMACLQATMGANVSTNNCVMSQCDPKCVGSFDTCDGNKFNGCEADTDSDEANCGDCGIGCSTLPAAHVTSNDCVGGACDPECSGTYDDCDTSRANGCETNTDTSKTHCGGCGAAFTCSEAAGAHVTTNNCTDGECDPTCSGLWDDCDTSRFNGCEHNVSDDEMHCGDCMTECKFGVGTNASASTCTAGSCNPSCNTGWGACANPEDGCLTPLGTPQHCRNCNESCSGSTPYCDPGGCVHFRDIIVGTSVHGIDGWNGNQGLAELSVNHTISWAKGSHRMVLVGVATTDNYFEPYSVSYDQKPMTLAASIASAGNSWAGVYYILDADLPNNAATPSPVLVRFDNGNAWGHGGFEVLELRNAQQSAPFVIGTNNGGNCGGGFQARSVGVTFSSPGSEPTKYDNSLVYAVLAARGTAAAADVTLDSMGVTQGWKEFQPDPDKLVGTAVRVLDSDSRTFNWTISNCYNTAQAAVAVQRLTGPP